MSRLFLAPGWQFAALGAALALAQAPSAWVWLMPAVLVAALWRLQGASGWRQAALWGWLWGAGYFAVGLRWITAPLLVDAAVTGWMAPFALVFMAGGMALFWAVGAAAGVALARRWGGGALAVALGLALAEAARAVIFTGFPWNSLAQAVMDTPAAWALPILGAGGLTSLLWLGLGTLAGPRPALWRGALALALGAALQVLPGPGALPAAAPGPGSPPVPVVRVVQPNAPQHLKWDPVYTSLFRARLDASTAAPPVPDLIVWPEMSLTALWDGDDALLAPLAAPQGATLVLGLPRLSEAGAYYNTLVVLDGQGQVWGKYDKRHLVPFGEYMPGGDLVARLGIQGLAAGDGGYSPGQDGAVLQVPGIGLAKVLICYEAIFAPEVREMSARPRLLILITNDAWFGAAAGPAQHLIQARMRALELGLPMARAANTGISAVIDAHGTVIAALALGTDGHLDQPLPQALPPTVYARWAGWPHRLVIVLAALVLSLLRRKNAL